MTVAPTAVPPTVTSTTEAGRSTCATAAAAAARPRSSKRRAGGLAERRRHHDLQLAGRRADLDREAGLAEDADHARGSTGARRRRTCVTPAVAATPARCASRIVAMPRPCQLVGDLERELGALRRLRREHGVGDDPLGRADRHDEPRAVAGIGARRRRAVEVRARGEEAQPARVVRHAGQQRAQAVDVVGAHLRARAPSSRRAARRRRAGRRAAPRLSPRARSPACGARRAPRRRPAAAPRSPASCASRSSASRWSGWATAISARARSASERPRSLAIPHSVTTWSTVFLSVVTTDPSVSRRRIRLRP